MSTGRNVALLAALACAWCATACAGGGAAVTATASPTTVAPTTVAPTTISSTTVSSTTVPPTWTLVAIGDSYLSGSGSHGRSLVDAYAEALNASGRRVVLTNLVDPAMSTESLLRSLTSDVYSSAVAGGDIILLSVGGNDVDPFATYPAGTCAPVQPRTLCLQAYAPHFAANFESVLLAILRLRSGRPTAIRVLGTDNPFVGWDRAPTQSFGVDFYAPVAAAETAAMCDVAAHHGAACIDIMPSFGGLGGLKDPKPFLAADHNHLGDRGIDTIVGLLMTSGLDPLA